MVVDEELKMMSAVCSGRRPDHRPAPRRMMAASPTPSTCRGAVTARVTRDILQTLFAPTVTGSCRCRTPARVITRHEHFAARLLLRRRHPSSRRAPPRPRPPAGRPTTWTRRSSSAPPTWSTGGCVYWSGPPSCDTRDPYGEVSETHGKAAGVLGAIGAVPRDRAAEAAVAVDVPPSSSTRTPRPRAPRGSPTTPSIATLLASRNARLAAFWLNPQTAGSGRWALGSADGTGGAPSSSTPRTSSRRCSPISCATSASRWRSCRGASSPTSRWMPRAARRGPGPGDPRESRQPALRRMREVVARRRASGGRCWRCVSATESWRIRSASISRRSHSPHQGLQRTVDVFEDAVVDRLLQHVHGARDAGHHEGRRCGGRGRTRRRATSTHCADAGSASIRDTWSRSCPATAWRRWSASSRTRCTRVDPGSLRPARAAMSRRSASFAVSSSGAQIGGHGLVVAPEQAQQVAADGVPQVVLRERLLKPVAPRRAPPPARPPPRAPPRRLRRTIGESSYARSMSYSVRTWSQSVSATPCGIRVARGDGGVRSCHRPDLCGALAARSSSAPRRSTAAADPTAERSWSASGTETRRPPPARPRVPSGTAAVRAVRGPPPRAASHRRRRRRATGRLGEIAIRRGVRARRPRCAWLYITDTIVSTMSRRVGALGACRGCAAGLPAEPILRLARTIRWATVGSGAERGPGDLRRRESAHRPQREGELRVGGQGGVAAAEQQRQAGRRLGDLRPDPPRTGW